MTREKLLVRLHETGWTPASWTPHDRFLAQSFSGFITS